VQPVADPELVGFIGLEPAEYLGRRAIWAGVQFEPGEVTLQGPRRGCPALLGFDDPGDMRGGAGRAFTLARDTVTDCPDGPIWTWAASSRTSRPRSVGDRPASASGRINEYRYSAISRARSARDFFFGFDICCTSTLL